MRQIAITAVLVSSLVAGCTRVTSPSESASSKAPEVVARFDPGAGELPEGLVMGSDTAYVGFAPTSRVVRVDVERRTVTAFGELPAPAPGKGFMTGLALSAQGDVYAGLASFTPEIQAGIYRIPAAGGRATLFAKDQDLSFPNALAFDADGTLFVTDSGSGSLLHVDTGGHVSRWSKSDKLLGDKDACGGAGPGFPIGANGLVVERDAIYVVNLDQATLLKIPRTAGGAGAAVVVAGPDCEALGGADGLARAPDGSFVVAVNRQNKVVRVQADGAVQTVLSGAPLDFPATLAYRGSTLFATNFALANASAGKPAMPGLLKLGDRF